MFKFLRYVNIYNNNKAIFKNKQYKTSDNKVISLNDSLDSCISTYIPTSFNYPKPPVNTYADTEIVVTNRKTGEAVADYSSKNGRFKNGLLLNSSLSVLNFASGTTPGGQYSLGATAQEEDLCRQSTLYPALCKVDQFYKINYRNPKVYSDGIIYTPDIVFFRDDNLALLDKPFSANIISAPAVNRSGINRQSKEELDGIMKIRISKILNIASLYGDSVILGAFGCGAFKNNPSTIASIFKGLLSNEFKGVFKYVEFAVYGNKTYKVFKGILANDK